MQNSERTPPSKNCTSATYAEPSILQQEAAAQSQMFDPMSTTRYENRVVLGNQYTKIGPR